MTATLQNLWPTDFGKEEQLAPVAILRQQGNALGERTQNIVVGRVTTAGNPTGFRHHFILYCPPLAYQIAILDVEHSLDFYPAKITLVGQPGVAANNPEEFAKRLEEAFASEQVKKVVRSLLAQSKQ